MTSIEMLTANELEELIVQAVENGINDDCLSYYNNFLSLSTKGRPVDTTTYQKATAICRRRLAGVGLPAKFEYSIGESLLSIKLPTICHAFLDSSLLGKFLSTNQEYRNGNLTVFYDSAYPSQDGFWNTPDISIYDGYAPAPEFPAFVIEIGVTQSYSTLSKTAIHHLLGSRGQITTVLIIKICTTPKEGGVELEAVFCQLWTCVPDDSMAPYYGESLALEEIQCKESYEDGDEQEFYVGRMTRDFSVPPRNFYLVKSSKIMMIYDSSGVHQDELQIRNVMINPEHLFPNDIAFTIPFSKLYDRALYATSLEAVHPTLATCVPSTWDSHARAEAFRTALCPSILQKATSAENVIDKGDSAVRKRRRID